MMENENQNEREEMQRGVEAAAGMPVPENPYAMQIEAAKPRRRMSKGKIIAIVVAVALVLLFVANSIIGALKGPTPAYVETQPVAKESVHQTLSTNGTLVTGEKITVYSLVSAPVTEVNAQLGSVVQAGQLLFGYDTKDLERSYRQASAGSGLAALQTQAAKDASDESQKMADEYKTSTDNLKDQQARAQANINSAAENLAQVQMAQAQYIADAKTELEGLLAVEAPTSEQLARILELGQNIAAAQAEIDTASAQLASAQQSMAENSALLAQVSGLKDTAEKSVMSENSQKQAQLSQVSSAVAFEMARDNLNMGQQGVLAPISGVVTALNAGSGGMAAQYNPLCVIESLEKIDVSVQLSRYDLERVKVGQKAVVTTLGKEYDATVTKIDAMATQTASASGSSSYVMATVSLKNPDPSIVLGLEATVEIATGSVENALAIPVSAANTDVNGTYCFVVENGVAHRREIVLGLSSDTVVEVQKGLQEGDEVILVSQDIIDGANVSTDPAYKTAAKTGIMMGVS